MEKFEQSETKKRLWCVGSSSSCSPVLDSFQKIQSFCWPTLALLCWSWYCLYRKWHPTFRSKLLCVAISFSSCYLSQRFTPHSPNCIQQILQILTLTNCFQGHPGSWVLMGCIKHWRWIKLYINCEINGHLFGVFSFIGEHFFPFRLLNFPPD